jgi:hypothetical protein
MAILFIRVTVLMFKEARFSTRDALSMKSAPQPATVAGP